MSSSAKRPLPSRNDTITMSYRDLMVFTIGVMAATASMSVLLTLTHVTIAQQNEETRMEIEANGN